MAKLNKELQENLKEINNIIMMVTEFENNFILSTSIHDNLIVVSINYNINGNVESGETFYISEYNEAEETIELINKIKKTLGL